MILIKNGNVHFAKGKTENLDILIKGKKIVEVGKNLSADAEVIDASACEVFPGFILPTTSVGIYNYADLRCTDSNERAVPINPDLHVHQALDPVEVKMQGYEKHGITTFGAVPGNSALIAGQMGLYHTNGRSASDMAVSEDVALKIDFLSEVKKEFAPRNFAPMTRMGMAAMLRKEFLQTIHSHDTKYNPERSVYQKVLEGKLPILCNVREKCDIETMLELKKEFGFKLILMGAYQAGAVHETLKEMQTPVILGDLIDASYLSYYHADIHDLISVSKDIPMACSNNSTGFEGLLWSAEKMVRNGLAIEDAIDMITINPAKILGVEDRIGSIEVGKYADISIWNAHPLKTYSAHIEVCITAGRVWRANS